MSDYSELIKRFDKIRDYMRDFYVYGFKSREDYNNKSLRTYDNEKRRIESYLSDVMSFRQDEDGKTVFLSLDGALVSQNPLYRPFKAKTFTKNDITLHFILLDIFACKSNLSISEIDYIITTDYLSFFENTSFLDTATIRNKLKEYENLGLVLTNKQGKNYLYSINTSEIDLDLFYDSLTYFSEISPVGVIGSFLLDKINQEKHHITFKHHYIMHALDSEVTLEILEAINQKRNIEISSFHPRSKKAMREIIAPVKILASVNGGRQYICGFNHKLQKYVNYRIDYIKSIKHLEVNLDFDRKRIAFDEILNKTWGVSFHLAKTLEKVEILFKIEPSEDYIVQRILREGRGGTLKQIDENTYKYEIEVFDAGEMIPWIRTFIGRIQKFECSNKNTQQVFYDDLNKLYEIYGGKSDVI